MKNLVKIVAVMAIACFVTLKAYDKQNMNISDVVLANVEALADKSEIDLPPVVVTCSKDCTDGIGRCWIDAGVSCVFCGYMEKTCSHLPCASSNGGPN